MVLVRREAPCDVVSEIINALLMGTRRRVSGRRRHGCWDHLIVAPLWVSYQANLGTLLRTCDAVGACMAVPRTPHYRDALARGNTLPGRSCVHWVAPSKVEWLGQQHRHGGHIVVVELAEDATPLPRAEASRRRTVVLLGHERTGVPLDAQELADEAMQIPMTGRGVSLNVAVAGSLVLYRLAGLM